MTDETQAAAERFTLPPIRCEARARDVVSRDGDAGAYAWE